LDIVSRLVGRPFLTSTASQRLKQLEKMLSTADAIPDASWLLDNLKAALCEAEGVLDDIEHQHLCLQGLIMSYQDEVRNVSFVIKTIKYLFFQYRFARSI
jgi:hypothetical protein